MAKRLLVYMVMFLASLGALVCWPPRGGYVWEPWLINGLTAVLFTLLSALTARLVKTDRTLTGLLFTALFLALFCPGAESFFERDEAALLALGSQCIVPFFIGQYMRVSSKNYGRWYLLMALMGVFCSYTHSGIGIPLCGAMVWLSFMHRRQFFRRACWPMVMGFVVGTALSIWHAKEWRMGVDTGVLLTLWNTKVFVLSLALTVYMASTRGGRRLVVGIGRRHYVLSFCLLAGLLSLPLAPLGIDNATFGLCFFSMLWALILIRYLVFIYFNKRL